MPVITLSLCNQHPGSQASGNAGLGQKFRGTDSGSWSGGTLSWELLDSFPKSHGLALSCPLSPSFPSPWATQAPVTVPLRFPLDNQSRQAWGKPRDSTTTEPSSRSGRTSVDAVVAVAVKDLKESRGNRSRARVERSTAGLCSRVWGPAGEEEERCCNRMENQLGHLLWVARHRAANPHGFFCSCGDRISQLPLASGCETGLREMG